MSRLLSRARVVLFLLLTLAAPAFAEPTSVTRVAALIDPAKIATLKGERAANDRLLKAVCWLALAAADGENPADVITAAQDLNGPENPARDALVKASLLRNLDIAAKLGCLSPENLARMRRGVSPVISFGPYAGQAAEVDHIIPLALAPHWGKEIANLELLPRTLNRRKGASFGDRQRALWRAFAAAGMEAPVRVDHPAKPEPAAAL